MKKAATIVAIAGVAMASGIEGVEDHSFLYRGHTVGGILPTIREKAVVAHDDFADDHFAVQDLADDTLFSLFKKKKHPQQPQPQTKPTNPDDVVDFEPIHVDLNSNEFFAEELGNDEFSMLSSLFHKKKKPQHNPDEFKPREIPSNEFFADEEMWSRTDLPLHPVNKDRDVIKPRYKIIAHDRVEYDDELFAAEDLGDDNFGLLSIFKKKKKPQQQEQPSQPKEIPSNEFFAEELGNDEFSMLSSLFHKKKKPQHNPEEFKPREIPSNEFFAAEDIADDNFSGMLWFKPKKDQKEQKEKKHHHPHPEKPAQDKPVPVPKPNVNATNNATSNELFSLKDIFHHKKKPQQPQQPQGPVEIPSNEFFAENLGDDEYSVFSNLFHKKKHPHQPQPQTKPTNPDDIVDFEPIHVDLNSNEFFAEELGNDEFSMLSSLFHKKKKPQHNPEEFKPREIPSNEFFSLKDLFHHKKKPQQPQQPQGPVEIPSNEFFADEIADDALFFEMPIFKKTEKNRDMFGPKKYGFFGSRKSGLNLDELADGEFARMGGPQISLIKHDKERTKKPVEKAIAADEFGDDELVHIPAQMGPGRGSYNPTIRGASLQHLGRLLREAN